MSPLFRVHRCFGALGVEFYTSLFLRNPRDAKSVFLKAARPESDYKYLGLLSFYFFVPVITDSLFQNDQKCSNQPSFFAICIMVATRSHVAVRGCHDLPSAHCDPHKSHFYDSYGAYEPVWSKIGWVELEWWPKLCLQFTCATETHHFCSSGTTNSSISTQQYTRLVLWALTVTAICDLSIQSACRTKPRVVMAFERR